MGASEKLSIVTASVLTFIVGISVRGDWLLLIVTSLKQLPDTILNQLAEKKAAFSEVNTGNETSVGFDLEQYYMKDVHWYVLLSVAISFGTYWICGGALDYHYYKRRRSEAKEWKCQPDKFLTPENEKHAIYLGSINMVLASVISGLVSAYISNRGPCKLYYSISDRGWPYFIISIPLFFLFCDGLAYYSHRFFHWPPFYKRIHKIHHRYHQPIIWTATAMHPLELFILNSAMLFPIFVLPVHAVVFSGNLAYSYYYGMIDHSGIKMNALWPWQPPSTFHDDHHKYFHCNIGFNTPLWDWMHGTLHSRERRYGEDIFGCKGATKSS